MTIRQAAAGFGAVATAAMVGLAVTTIWLVLSDPAAVASAVGDGDFSGVAAALVKMLARQLAKLVFGR